MAAFGAITKAAQEDVSSKPEKTVLVPKSVGVEVSCFCTRFIIHRRKLVKSLLTYIFWPSLWIQWFDEKKAAWTRTSTWSIGTWSPVRRTIWIRPCSYNVIVCPRVGFRPSWSGLRPRPRRPWTLTPKWPRSTTTCLEGKIDFEQVRRANSKVVFYDVS